MVQPLAVTVSLRLCSYIAEFGRKSTKLKGIYSVADLLHMVKSIKQRMTVDAHPHKQLMKILIGIEDV